MPGIGVFTAAVALLVGITGDDDRRQYPGPALGISTGSHAYRGDWQGQAFGLTYYGPQVGRGTLAIGADFMGGNAYYLRAGLHYQLDAGGDWFLASQYGVGHLIEGSGPSLLNGSPALFYAQVGLGHQITDRASVVIWATHHSNAHLGTINPGIDGVRVEFMVRF